MSIRTLWSLPLLAILLPACGSSDTGTATGTTGGPTDLVNGCDLGLATDKTMETNVTISFGGAEGLVYVPACAKIKAGTIVTFQGGTPDTFATHPLQAGTIVNGVATPATGSVITETKTGTSAMFTFPAAGSFPYYCENHGVSAKMMGDIFVQ